MIRLFSFFLFCLVLLPSLGDCDCLDVIDGTRDYLDHVDADLASVESSISYNQTYLSSICSSLGQALGASSSLDRDIRRPISDAYNNASFLVQEFSTLLSRVSSSRDHVTSLYSYLLEFSANCNCTNVINIVITNVVSSSSSPGCSCDLTGIQTKLDQLVLDVNQIKTDFDIYMDDYQDIRESYKEYWELVVNRVKSVDFKLVDDLRDSWSRFLDVAQSATNRYSSSDVLADVLAHVGSHEGDIRLSNEGYIALYNYAANEKSYLVETKMLDALYDINQAIKDLNLSSSNVVDLSWVTNYLHDVQQPLFDIFQRTILSVRSTTPDYRSDFNPFSTSIFNGYSQYQTVTNFLFSHTKKGLKGTYYEDYRNLYTNWFDRIEYALYANMGLFDPVSPSDTTNFFDTAQSVIDDVQSRLDQVSGKEDSLQSSLSSCFDSFKSFFSSIELQTSSDDELTICPAVNFGSWQTPDLKISGSDFDSIRPGCKLCFHVVWIVLLALLYFYFLLAFLYVCSRIFLGLFYLYGLFAS